MAAYHGIIVEESLDKGTLGKLRVIGRKRGAEFSLLKVEVEEGALGKIQKSLKPGYYAHFYKNDELIIVFPKKIFRVTPEKRTWKGAIAYGLSLGIPGKQLAFFPRSFREETW